MGEGQQLPAIPERFEGAWARLGATVAECTAAPGGEGFRGLTHCPPPPLLPPCYGPCVADPLPRTLPLPRTCHSSAPPIDRHAAQAIVEEAQAKPSSIGVFVDRFARFYTPALLVFAVAVLFIPPLLTSQPFGASLHTALLILV